MLDLSYVLVPKTVSSATVLEDAACYGVLDVPGVAQCSLFVLRGSSIPQGAPWFDPENVVLTGKSNTLLANVAPAMDALAVAAVLDAQRATAVRPPALMP